MKKNGLVTYSLIVILLTLVGEVAHASVSQNGSFKLYNGVANPIVNVSQSSSFKLNTSGLPVAGVSTNTNFSLQGGSVNTPFTPSVGAGGGGSSGGVGAPDRVSVGSSLSLLGNESGVLLWVMEDSRVVQIDVSKGSFPTNAVVYVKEEKIQSYDLPLSSSPAVAIGSSAFRVMSSGGGTSSAVPTSKPFVAKINQPAGKPLPTDSKVYYFDDTNKIWVQITSAKQEGNGLVFVAQPGIKYAAFATSSNQILLSTKPETILDVNKDGKVDLVDRKAIVPISQNIDIPLSENSGIFPIKEIVAKEGGLLKFTGKNSDLKQVEEAPLSGGKEEDILKFIEENVEQKPFQENTPFTPSAPTAEKVGDKVVEDEKARLFNAESGLVGKGVLALVSVLSVAVVGFVLYKFIPRSISKKK